VNNNTKKVSRELPNVKYSK